MRGGVRSQVLLMLSHCTCISCATVTAKVGDMCCATRKLDLNVLPSTAKDNACLGVVLELYWQLYSSIQAFALSWQCGQEPNFGVQK